MAIGKTMAVQMARHYGGIIVAYGDRLLLDHWIVVFSLSIESESPNVCLLDQRIQIVLYDPFVNDVKAGVCAFSGHAHLCQRLHGFL